MEVLYFIIYRGTTYKQRPRSVPAPGNLEEAQKMWDDSYKSPVEVARRKARKSAMRRPDLVEAIERRVAQRRADPEQEAVNLGALAHQPPPRCSLLERRTRAATTQGRASTSRPAPRAAAASRMPCHAFGCCISSLIAAASPVPAFGPQSRAVPSGSVGKITNRTRLRNQTRWTERTRIRLSSNTTVFTSDETSCARDRS